MLSRSQYFLSRLARSPAGLAPGLLHPNARRCFSRTLSTTCSSRLILNRPSSFRSSYPPACPSACPSTSPSASPSASPSLIITRSYAKRKNSQQSSREEPSEADTPPTPTPEDQQIPAFIEPTSTSRPSSQDRDPPSQANPFAHLPDLTQGIPSTWEYEASQASRSALTTVHDQETGPVGHRETPSSSSAYVSSADRRRQALLRWVWSGLAAALLANAVLLGSNWDEIDKDRHPDIPNGWGLRLWWNRARQRLQDWKTYYHDPAFDKLLPDVDPSFERPYTLVIGLEDFLIHSEWSREHGWRIAKRPGMDYFVRYLSQYYEIVIFATMPWGIGEPLVRKLDPFRFIMWPLFREATKWKDGAMVKDISYLNRDLSKVIVLDTDPSLVQNQPENAVIMPKWTGDPKDDGLVAMIPFLEYVFAVRPSDVRPVLKSFEGKHIPAEFARREAIARKEFNAKQQRRTRRSGDAPAFGLGSVFGSLKPKLPDGEQDPAAAFAEGKMLHDIQRDRGQTMYKFLDEQIRVNGEKWIKEDADLQEKMQQEALAGMKASVKSYMPFASGGMEKVNGDNGGPREEGVEKQVAGNVATAAR